MAKAGRIPTGDTAQMFWPLVLDTADRTENAALYEQSLNALKEVFRGMEQRSLLDKL